MFYSPVFQSRVRRIPENRPAHEFKVPPGSLEDPYGSASSDDESVSVSPNSRRPRPDQCRICSGRHADTDTVLRTASILQNKLPLELVLQVLDQAEYWRCSRVRQSRSERFTFQWKDSLFAPLVPSPNALAGTTSRLGKGVVEGGRRWRPRRLEVLFTVWMGLRYVEAYGSVFEKPEEYWEKCRGSPVGWWMSIKTDDWDLGFVDGKEPWPKERGKSWKENDECVFARKTWDVLGEEKGGALRFKEQGGDEFVLRKTDPIQISIYLRNHRYCVGGVYVRMLYALA